MLVIRTIILAGCLALVGLAQGRSTDNSYVQVELKDFVNRSADLVGRRVMITAEIISVSAKFHTIDVFDNGSKKMAVVSLAQLPKSQRQTLINEPIHRVSVFGRVEMKNGRTIIKADQVMPLTTNLMARN